MIIATYTVTGGKGYITGTMLHEALGGDLCVLQADRMLSDSAVMVRMCVCVYIYIYMYVCACECFWVCVCAWLGECESVRVCVYGIFNIYPIFCSFLNSDLKQYQLWEQMQNQKYKLERLHFNIKWKKRERKSRRRSDRGREKQLSGNALSHI